ncbi:MAG: PQQ-binding-like beta-propeller repeat protein, partial [Bacteroidota bacterium]
MRHTTNTNSRWYGGAAALCIVTLIASACTPLRLREPVRLDEAAWTTDLGATSRSRAVDAPAVFPLRQAWRYNASAGFGPGSALAADGLVIVSTRKGDVHAIEAETGRRKGIRKVVEVAEGAPVLTSNYLYVPSAWGGHVVNAYDLVRGRSQWKIKGAPV